MTREHTNVRTINGQSLLGMHGPLFSRIMAGCGRCNCWLWQPRRRHRVRTHASCAKCWQHVGPLGVDEARRSMARGVLYLYLYLWCWVAGLLGCSIGPSGNRLGRERDC